MKQNLKKWLIFNWAALGLFLLRVAINEPEASLLTKFLAFMWGFNLAYLIGDLVSYLIIKNKENKNE